jgi:lysosomal acid lipase/cholesteryl ester hydrolase
MDPEELIQHWGYEAEVYSVTTKDGYILPLYRIPHGKEGPSATNASRPVVYLQHGLENSAADWLVNLPNESAAFIFADAGFDVWIGNFRGTLYSKTHTTLSSKDHKFWEFSWDEMAFDDLPALLGQVLNVTEAESIYYVGHSQGTMTGFALFAQDQVLAKRIKQFYAIAPILSMKHVQGPVKYAAPFTKSFKYISAIFGVDEFLPNTKLQKLWAKYVCPNPLTDLICTNLLLMIAGPNTHQINESRVPVIDSHSPAGTSVQNVVHLGQIINSGNFQAYDYGTSKKNKEHYGTSKPPLYDVSTFEIPIAFYSGDSDWIATPADVSYTISLFKNVVGNTFLTGFNHFDFVWGLNAAPKVYEPIIENIQKHFAH